MLSIDNDLLLKIILTLLVAALLFFIISTVTKPPKVVGFASLALLIPSAFATSKIKKSMKGFIIPPTVLVAIVIFVVFVVIMFVIWGDFRTATIATIGGFMPGLFSQLI